MALMRYVIHLAGLCCLLMGSVAAQTTSDRVEIRLVSSLSPGKSATLVIPRPYLSAKSAETLAQGSNETELLHIMVQHPTGSAQHWSAPSRKDARAGATGLVNVFMTVPIHQHQQDVGKWYLEMYMKEAKRKQVRHDPKRLENGLLKYEFVVGDRAWDVYSYIDKSSQTIAIRCALAICIGHRTWRGVVQLEYRYGRSMVEHARAVDDFLDRTLAEAYKRN